MSEKIWQRYSVAQGVLIHNNHLLLVANDYGNGNVLWSLPGGRLEPGEAHLETVVREFKEETGLEVVAQEFLYTVDALSHQANCHFITMAFRVSLADPEVEPVPVWETDVSVIEVRFVTFAEAAKLIQRPSLGEALMNYLYFGVEKMPRRYWHYPEYLSENWTPVSFPP
jgi:8-oxo-dGTP diphosphatase